tara:strand:+ start:851 stop:1039 length:189 start_codon:yes stop_codon:yes gene_type:complete
MSKKQYKKDEGLESYRLWMQEQKKLEKRGLHGTDYYVKRVEILEAKVKRLQNKLKLKRKGKQ